jgi:heme A synthase
MAALRAALRPWPLTGIVVWTLVLLAHQIFLGGGIGGPACYTDPTCGEKGWIPTATWIGGILLILALGYASRSDSERATTTTDKVVSLAVVLGVLLVAGAGFAIFLDRPFV